jgi:hypothetical protein
LCSSELSLAEWPHIALHVLRNVRHPSHERCNVHNVTLHIGNRALGAIVLVEYAQRFTTSAVSR